MASKSSLLIFSIRKTSQSAHSPADRTGREEVGTRVDGEGAEFKGAERAVNPADFGAGLFIPFYKGMKHSGESVIHSICFIRF